MFRKYLDSIVTISLLLFIIVNPLISSKTFPLGGGLIWILIYLSYLLIAFAREKPTFYYKTAFNFPILFFLSVLLANQFFSINHYNSLTELAHFISYILLFFVVVYASSKNKTKLIAAIMISGTIIAMYSVYQYYFGISNTLKIITQMPPSGTQSLVYAQDFLMFKRAFATFFSPDKLSAFLLYIVFISLGVSTTDSIDLRLKLFAIFNIALSFWVLLLTKSMGGILTLGISFILFLTFYVCNHKTFTRKMAIILIFILLLVILSGVLLLNIRLDETIQSFNFKNSISQRLDYWQAAFKIIHKFPFTGVGIGNFNIAYTKFKTALSNETYHAHNTFLQIFSEVGFLGFLSLALLLFYVLKTGLSKIKDSKAKNLEIGILVAALTFLIRNLFDYDFYVPELSSLFWICLGLLTPAMKFKKTPRNINILFAIVIIPTLLLQILNSLSLHYLKSSYRLTLNKEYKRSVSILEKAATIMPINSTVHNRLAKGYESSILEKGDPYFKKAILEHEKAISLSPHSAYNHRDIGLLLLNYGIKDRANHHLRKALKLYPTNMEFRIHLQETGN